MSRPPINRPIPSPRGIDPEKGEMTYFGLRFADLVLLAEELARDPEGVLIPGSTDRLAPGILEVPGKDRGLARTFIEIPSLFADILGEHQSHYATEAFLGTATLPDSLIRHSRRLAYAPDQGVAATGLAVFEVKKGLSGELPKNFSLQSEPKGDVKSQTYETLDSVTVSAAWNDIRPLQAHRATRIRWDDGIADLPLGAPSGLEPGELVMLVGQGHAALCEVHAATSNGLSLRLRSDPDPTDWHDASQKDPYIVLAQPKVETRLFGHAADPLSFPLTNLANPALYTGATGKTPKYGYAINGLSSSYTPGDSLILSEAITPPVPSEPVAVLQPALARTFTVANAREAAVSFIAGQEIDIPQPDPAPEGFPVSQTVERAFSARATLLDLKTPDGDPVTWSTFPLDAVLLAGWTRTVPIPDQEPNPEPMAAAVNFAADLSDILPGRAVIVEQISDGSVASATIARLEPVDIGWRVTLSFDGGAVASSFSLGDVRLCANVVKVSHGESKSDILGASDGITAHQRFALKSPQVTRLVGASGSSLELSVRVGGVLWDLVEDFHSAPEDARVARTEFDAEEVTTVVFGGEGRGAVPPSGTRNVTAEYRVGLGRVGDTDAGRLTRIKKSSPLLKSVTNPLPLSGGTDPARSEDMRKQATRPILTFDRAVSLQDYADLALIFPGIARAAARWLDRGAIELIAADAKGNAPAEPSALRAFLDERRDTQVPLILLEPQPVDIAVTLRIERDRTWLADAVRLEVSDLLLSSDPDTPGLFTFAARNFSAPQSLSGLYDKVLALSGVTGAQANRFAIAPATSVADILHATDRQWLRLVPNNLTLSVVDPGTLIPDVEDTE